MVLEIDWAEVGNNAAWVQRLLKRTRKGLGLLQLLVLMMLSGHLGPELHPIAVRKEQKHVSKRIETLWVRIKTYASSVLRVNMFKSVNPSKLSAFPFSDTVHWGKF